MIEQLKEIKSTLIAQIQGQMGKLDCVNTKELGEVIDMVKDLEEAIYYCTITKAMDKKDEEEEKRGGTNTYYYTERMVPPYYDYYRDVDRDHGRMYYDGNSSMPSSNSTSTSGSTTSNYSERPYPMMQRDSREGKSPISRRNYMETKQMHGDKGNQMHDLEQYLQELSNDITEMISGSSPEEKQLMQSKLMTLANKIISQ